MFPAGARTPSSVFTYTQPYNKTNFTVVPRVFLGQLSFDFFSNSTNNNSLMGYNITMGTPSLLTLNYQVTTYGVTIVGLHFIYLAVSPIYDQIFLMQNYYINCNAQHYRSRSQRCSEECQRGNHQEPERCVLASREYHDRDRF